MRQLYNGIRVNLWRIKNEKCDAGGYSVERVELFSARIEMVLGLGQPFECAYNEAERLAVVLDAEFMLDGKVLRESRKGEYNEHI